MSTGASEWAPRVAAWQASGETAAAFCRRKGFTESTFRYWARRLDELAASTALDEAVSGSASNRLARVRRRADRPVATPSTVAPALRVTVGDASVEVPAGFDAPTLSRLLDVLSKRGAA